MSDPIRIEYNPRDLPQRFARWPKVVEREMRKTMEASLLTFHENVPSYPSRPPNKYVRTGTLGKSLGVSQAGGIIGKSDIYDIRKLGGSNYEGAFGSQLHYAQYVIGDSTQAYMHRGIWWTMKIIRRRAVNKINRLFSDMMEDLAQFLEGKGA